MEAKNQSELVKKYWAGETSIAEEKALKGNKKNKALHVHLSFHPRRLGLILACFIQY